MGVLRQDEVPVRPKPSPVRVVAADDGWLFDAEAVAQLACTDADGSQASQTSAAALASAAADRWQQQLNSDSDWLAQQGIRYKHMTVPDKLTVYPEHCAAQLALSAQSPSHRLHARYRNRLPCLLDSSAYLLRQKVNFPIFWKNDTRWTPWAAYMTYQMLCGQLSVKSNPQLLGYAHTEVSQAMNLDDDTRSAVGDSVRHYRFARYSRIRYQNPLAQARTRLFSPNDAALSRNSLGQGAVSVFENRHADATPLSVVIFGDANSADDRSLLTGMLAETFAEVHFVWATGIDRDYVNRVKPDIVMTQVSEMQLLQLPAETLRVDSLATQSLQHLALQQSGRSAQDVETESPSLESCNTHGNEFHDSRVLLASEQYDLEPPNLVQDHPSCDAAETRMHTNEVTLTEVRKATVYFDGPSWLVHDGKKQEVLRHAMLDEKKAFGLFTRRQTLSGTSLLLATSAGAHCYYHWMLEILPKLGLLEREGITLSSIDHFLVRKITGDWQRQTLLRFGIDESRIVETERQPHYRCDHLLHIDLNCGINLKMHRFIPQWMKHLYPANVDDKPRLKLYVTRPAGVRRGIRNEEELLPLLHQAGFTTVAMEGLSVAEQAALLSRADVFMSPHGGALTNMVFCRPGIQVVELFSRHVFPYYYGLAANCGHRYHAILENPAEDYERLVSGRIAQRFADTQHTTAELSFDAPVKAVEKLLQQL